MREDITLKRKNLCVGSLRHKIGIYDRNLVGVQIAGNAVHKEIYTFVKFVFASIKTKTQNVFQTLDGVAIDPELVVTHTFLTRHISTITTEQFIQYKGLNYKILKVENIDEASEWISIQASFRGDATKAGAQ